MQESAVPIEESKYQIPPPLCHLRFTPWLLGYCLFEYLKVQNTSGYASSPSPHLTHTYTWVLRGWNLNKKEMGTRDRNGELCRGCRRFGLAHSSFGAVQKQGDFLAFRGVCNFSLGVIQGDVGRNCFKDASRCGTKQKAEIQTGYSSARCRALPRVSLPQCLRLQCHRAGERTEALVVHG